MALERIGVAGSEVEAIRLDEPILPSLAKVSEVVLSG